MDDKRTERIAELEQLCSTQTGLLDEMRAENQRLRKAAELAVEFLNRCEGAMALRELKAALEDCDKLDVAMEDKDEG